MTFIDIFNADIAANALARHLTCANENDTDSFKHQMHMRMAHERLASLAELMGYQITPIVAAEVAA